MKRLIPALLLLAAIAWVASKFMPAKPVNGVDLEAFGRLPVLAQGRIKPLDTIARTTLLQIQNRQAVYLPDGSQLAPSAWLLDLAFQPEKADALRTFAIDDPDVLNLINQSDDTLRITYDSNVKKVMAILGFLPSRYRRFAYTDIIPYFSEIERQVKLADSVEAPQRSRFQRAVIVLYQNLSAYQGIKYSFVFPSNPDFLGTLTSFQTDLPAAVAAAHSKKEGKPYDEVVFNRITDAENQFQILSDAGTLLVIPPLEGDTALKWRKTGQALLETFDTHTISPPALTYAGLGYAWRLQKGDAFNEIVRLYRAELTKRFPAELHKSDIEHRFNTVGPFYLALLLFIGAFLIAVASWLRYPVELGRSAFLLLVLAWVLTTAGILARMWIEGRPPVTNLYSSALFVGWCAVALCVILEAIFRNTVGTLAAGLVGFCALIIAHHLSLTGDTMEMMRAVLDNNFWLATHVVTVTIGYGATFLAGFLAIIYVVLDRFTNRLDKTTADALLRMVYGIVCFATLFSLVGTLLGGIWADQSWGRFWGWDPKENGALIIVLWNAIILHARWGGLVRARGLMALAIFGNVVTAWSWFGTNMLGVGLHSYGFMDAAFWALISFVGSQLILILVGVLPKWGASTADLKR